MTVNKSYIDPLLELAEYRQALSEAKEYSGPVNLTGASESQKAHICYALCRHSGLKGIYVAFNEMQARRLYEDFTFFCGKGIYFYPDKEITLYNVEAKNNEVLYQRTCVLDRVLRGDFKIIVTSIEAISHKLIHPDLLKDNIIDMAEGGSVELDNLSEKLVMMAYERVDMVGKQGQFAIRGGIVDIFPINETDPYRLELFGDEIDSIRTFNVNTQRSVKRTGQIRIIPARELIYSPDSKRHIISSIEKDLREAEGRHPALAKNIPADLDLMEESWYFPGVDRYIAYIADGAAESSSFVEYVAKDALVFLDEPARQGERLDNLLLEQGEICKGFLEKGQLLPQSTEMLFNKEQLNIRMDGRKVFYLSTINTNPAGSDKAVSCNIPGRLIGSFGGNMDLLCESLIRWKNERNRVVILSGTKGRGERLRETLDERGIESVYRSALDEFPYSEPVGEPTYPDSKNGHLKPGQIVIIPGSLYRGFEYPSIGFVIVSDRQIFGRDKKPAKTQGKQKGRPISLFTDLSLGDYVVHQAHGIGQYVAIEKLTVEGLKRDYLKIRYQEGAFLYIPTNQLDLIQKYIGSEGKSPKINKLGGAEWAKTKSKVKESLKELAAGLIELYAKRQATKGFAFTVDTVWQRQFEEQFPYEETEDQLKCIEEIKKDMETDRLMDRLLCGDVGFGKTEVALRAIFKAAMDGKQAAYLVPTTVLAQQQYNNFVERLQDFPVNVEVISRFKTRTEQKKILKNVKMGSVDILIGTHRLLQKDIDFRDLGLLVVDEEHRFGVAHKEKLKRLAPGVDVLTLTATPIPRTLHMSLAGIKDISIIEDPPEERYPVQTYVMEYNQDVVKDAIAREISRQGQVFYLHNRVRSIDMKTAEIQAMVPEARVASAHGQMEERQLEDVMISFIKGEFDVLVCTTIIESGLDMPNVNTIIVEDADKMGLAQLYQLRGRVGRSNRLAYAYITYKKDKVVTEIAEKRLQAIREFTELGSGFKIAMRDMEIRGAGNLLGSEQHGHMESVGYDMYCRLLDEAVNELKGVPAVKEVGEITIDISINAYIDDSYIGSESRKFEMYRKIASIRDEEDVRDVEDELTDRYGDIPEPVNNLIAIAYIKSLAGSLGFSAISEKNNVVTFYLSDAKIINFNNIGRVAEKYKRQLLFNAGATPYLEFRIPAGQGNLLTENIKMLLQDLKG